MRTICGNTFAETRGHLPCERSWRLSVNLFRRPGHPYQPVVQGPEFRKRGRRRLIEWFASEDIQNIEDVEFRQAIRPIPALQQQEEAQKQLSLLILPLPRLARTQQHP